MSKENINGDVLPTETLLQRTEPFSDIQIRNSAAAQNGENFSLMTDVPRLESIAERRMRKYSHYVVYSTTFIMSIGFSIILTGVWPYLKQLDPSSSKEYLGWVIAANPIGQMVFSPILGWWANKVGSTRIAFVVTIILSVIGSAMYALLPLMQTYAKYLIFVSRFIVGLSGANIAICRSYIVASTKLKERTSALASVAAAQAIGFILGPIIQSGIAYCFQGGDMVSDPTAAGNTIELYRNGIPWNMYSAVGYVGAFISAFNLILFSPYIFKDTSLKTSSHESKPDENDDPLKPDYPAILSLLYSFFIVGLLFVLLESMIVPMVLDLYAYDYKTAVFKVGIGLSVLGVVAFFVFIIMAVVSTRVNNDRVLYLLFGFVPMTIGMLLHVPVGSEYPIIMNCSTSGLNDTQEHIADWQFFSVPPPDSTNGTCNPLGCPYFQEWCYYTPIIEKPQLIVAQLVTVIGYAVSFSLAPPLYSKMLGPQPQGLWMGIMSTIGGSARIVGPVFAVYVYSDYGPRWLFGLLFGLFMCTNLVICFFYKRLVPLDRATRSPQVAPTTIH